jgi:hypothetical protein
MEQVKIPSPLEASIFVKKLGIQNPGVVALLRSYAVDPTPEKYSRLFKFVSPYLVRNALKPDPFRSYPANGEVAGPIKLGLCNETGALFGLYPEELHQGFLNAGRPGSGKTTLCYRLITEANKFGINCLILDLKQDYRHLIRILPNTLVFRCCTEDAPYLLKWNVFESPGSIESWIPIVSKAMSETYGFYQGTDNYIAKHAYELYEETKPFPPTLIQLKKKIEEDRQPLIKRDARFKETSLNRIDPLVTRAYKTLNCAYGYNIEKLLKKYNVVVEMDNLGPEARSCFTTLILAHVFQSGILNRNEPCQILVITDEANETYNRIIERQRGDLIISQLTREAREFRIGIAASCQLPESLSDSVKNCYTRIMMSLSEGENIRSFSQSLGLTPEQKEIVWQLQPGQAIVRFARYPRPFLVVFPNYPIEKNVSNDELARHMQNFASELGIKREYRENNAKPIFLPMLVKKSAPNEKTGPKSKEKELLMDIYLHPYDFKTQHYKNVGLSAGNGTAIFKSLVSKGLCIEEEINLGGRGGLSSIPVLTESGHQAIGMQPKTHIGRGAGFQHEYWQVKISEHLKKAGHKKVEIEKNLNSKFVDIAVETEKGVVAIEIAITSEHEKINVEKDLEAGCKKIIIACTNKAVLEQVSSLKNNNVSICLTHELLKIKNLEEITRREYGLF